MLHVKNLCKTYKTGNDHVAALRNVSIDIKKGEIFGFAGLSGAGKTSLARCVSMLERPDSGQVILGGTDLCALSGGELREQRKRLSMVFQHFNLLMNSNVFDNIAFPLVIAKKPKDYINERVTRMIELVGLQDKKHAFPAKLSGGQKQRVGIARALAAEPELVICDEATSALDPETTRSILRLVRDINSRTGVTFVIITHEMDVIKQLCDRAAVMEAGEIIEHGSVSELTSSPKTARARSFFTGFYAPLDRIGGDAAC